MEQAYDEVMQLVGEQLESGTPPLEVAAVLVAISLRMYRTILTDGDFNSMVDSISEGRDRIQPLSSGHNQTLQ